jgi:hypothetical protein
MSTVHRRAFKVGAAQICVLEMGFKQLGVLQVSTFEVGRL